MIGAFIWLALGLAAGVGFVFTWRYQTEELKRHSYRDRTGWSICLILFLLGWFVPPTIVTGIAWDYSLRADNSYALVELKTEQRDELAVTIREEMSDETFVRLMQATTESDLTILLGAGVSEYVVARAKEIIDINKELYDLQLAVTNARVSACGIVQNPIIPKWPILPSCDL